MKALKCKPSAQYAHAMSTNFNAMHIVVSGTINAVNIRLCTRAHACMMTSTMYHVNEVRSSMCDVMT